MAATDDVATSAAIGICPARLPAWSRTSPLSRKCPGGSILIPRNLKQDAMLLSAFCWCRPAMMRLLCVATLTTLTAALQCGISSRAKRACTRTTTPLMDETILEKALSGELEQEGAENVFMSEVGWASYLDKEAGQSYNMNERVSKAQDGYFTPTVLSNPLDVLVSWKDSMLRVASDPLEASFLTISNDKSGARSYGEGVTEVNARTIKPKVKDFNQDMRVSGIPGFNLFGAPSSKSVGVPTVFGTPKSKEQLAKEQEPGLFDQIAGFFGKY